MRKVRCRKIGELLIGMKNKKIEGRWNAKLVLPTIGVLIVIECIVLFVIVLQIREGSRKAREANDSKKIESSVGVILHEEFSMLESEIKILEESETEIVDSGFNSKGKDTVNFDSEIEDVKSEENFKEDSSGSKTVEESVEKEESVNTENWGTVDWD